jgi:hypothetical protein
VKEKLRKKVKIRKRKVKKLNLFPVTPKTDTVKIPGILHLSMPALFQLLTWGQAGSRVGSQGKLNLNSISDTCMEH